MSNTTTEAGIAQNPLLAAVKPKRGELPLPGHVYWLKDFTAPKVFNGLYYECLVTDQKIPAFQPIKLHFGHIHGYPVELIYKPKRFGLNGG